MRCACDNMLVQPCLTTACKADRMLQVSKNVAGKHHLLDLRSTQKCHIQATVKLREDPILSYGVQALGAHLASHFDIEHRHIDVDNPA